MLHLITTVEASRIQWLDQFVRHYREAGVMRFHISIHFLPCVPADTRRAIHDCAAETLRLLDVAKPSFLICNYDAMSLRRHHDAIQRSQCSYSDWVIWADIDEFHGLPPSFEHLIEEWDKEGVNICGGAFIDRVASDGSLPVFDVEQSIWDQYPRDAHVTKFLVGGDIRKVVCSRATVKVRFGNHAPDENQFLHWAREHFAVYHFKWDASVVERLRQRLAPDWRERCWWWTESSRVIQHLEANSGRLDLAAIERLAIESYGEHFRSIAP